MGLIEVKLWNKAGDQCFFLSQVRVVEKCVAFLDEALVFGVNLDRILTAEPDVSPAEVDVKLWRKDHRTLAGRRRKDALCSNQREVTEVLWCSNSASPCL